jgi:hypothetical protein
MWTNVATEGKRKEVADTLANCDETGLFFQALPNKTLCLKGEKYSGKKTFKKATNHILEWIYDWGNGKNPLALEVPRDHDVLKT